MYLNIGDINNNETIYAENFLNVAGDKKKIINSFKV